MKHALLQLRTCALAFSCGLAFAAPEYRVIYKTEDVRFAQDAIIDMVNGALNMDSFTEEYSDVNVFVYSKQFGTQYYLVANLLRPNQYGIESYRLNIEDGKVAVVEPDYVEVEPLEEDFCATCPDPEVQVVFAYITDFPGSTHPAVRKTEDALRKANIRYKKLKDNEEDKRTFLNYLSCPKLVLYGRIGHGMAHSINFGYKGMNGTFTTREIAPNKELFRNKFFPFNSCYVGGNRATFGKGLIQAGGRWMCGGDDVVLQAGTSEPVWASFMADVCTGGEVSKSFERNMGHAQDQWRCHFSGKAPFYPFKDGSPNPGPKPPSPKPPSPKPPSPKPPSPKPPKPKPPTPKPPSPKPPSPKPPTPKPPSPKPPSPKPPKPKPPTPKPPVDPDSFDR